MTPPVFQYASASARVKELLGSGPVRFWPFGSAPKRGQPLYALPYAVWQRVIGSPDNNLAGAPADDNEGYQMDGYAESIEEARAIIDALRSAMEPYGTVVALNPEGKDPPTGLWRSSITVEFWTAR